MENFLKDSLLSKIFTDLSKLYLEYILHTAGIGFTINAIAGLTYIMDQQQNFTSIEITSHEKLSNGDIIEKKTYKTNFSYYNSFLVFYRFCSVGLCSGTMYPGIIIAYPIFRLFGNNLFDVIDSFLLSSRPVSENNE